MKKRLLLLAGYFLTLACGSAEEMGDQLGSSEDPIIGGVVDTGDPSVVAIFAHQPGSSSGSLCTGTLISSRSVLTAAHCVDPSVVGRGNIFEVYTGTLMSASDPLTVSGTVFDPAFDPSRLQNGHDIAIVTLAQPTMLTPMPINRGPIGNTSVRLVGYGVRSHFGAGSGIKRQVTTDIVTSSATLVKIGSTSSQTCHGDSGGPAFQTIGGVEQVIGVTSYGTDLGMFTCIGGGYDTRVDAYLPFIDANITP